jgi:regulator of sigma E protease
MTTVVSFLFVLGILVFVHEFGHFMAAKKAGVKVEQFSLGFPPKMLGKKVGETEYCISWIPLGGYVKMAGENPEEELKGEPWEFMSKPVWTRALIVSAGPIMNFILAVLVFWGIFFFQGIQQAHTDKSTIGIVAEDSPAQKAGIQTGDEILSINDQAVKSFDEMAGIINSQVEKPLKIVWKRKDQELSATIITMKDEILDKDGKTKSIGKIGIGATYTVKKISILAALWEGAKTSGFILKETIRVVIGLVSGSLSLKMIGGPVFIAQVAGESARHGFVNLLFFIALLSVNLSLLNILPIPALDGGHLLFLLIEKLKGKPLSIKFRAVTQQIGFALLILLIIMVTYNDILRAFK